MIISMIGVNEEEYVDRVMKDIHDEEWVNRIIYIDGGSTDYTREEMSKWPKVEIFVHPWLDWYHDMQSMQRNISLSYVPHGQITYIHDFDERMTEGLKKYLSEVNQTGMVEETDLIHVQRETIEIMRYPSSPYAVIGADGWPIKSTRIGQYPDPQPRLIKKNSNLFWGNSPHHNLRGVRNQTIVAKVDILHYEKNDARHRFRIERKWAREKAMRKALGLPFDDFECRLKPEVAKYGNPEEWK